MPPETWRRSHHAGVVLPRDEAHDGVEGTGLEATVRDDSSEGHAKTSVEGKEVLEASSRLIETNEQTVEGLLSEPTSEARRVRA